MMVELYKDHLNGNSVTIQYTKKKQHYHNILLWL
jgi:hypothetical protein